MKPTRILIMAGGTGGHVFPALAIAEALKKQDIDVQWLGTPSGIEAHLVPQAQIPLRFITIGGVRGKNWKEKIASPYKILLATIQAIKILRHYKPHAVLGLGGFASGPGGLAAVALHIPLYIHEQNAKAGMTNTLLSFVAKKIMQAFPNTFPRFLKPQLTGNPIRESIIHLPPPEHRFKNRTGPLHMLILGGSGGALALNQIIPDTFKLLPNEFCEIWHQTGKLHFETTQKKYQDLSLKVKIEPFIADMAAAYQWADLVICRAGALTVSELAAAGVGSVLIPYPFAVDDHQTKNAHYLVDKEAAILLPQTQLYPQNLAKILLTFTRENLLEKAKQAYRLRIPNATELVVNNFLC